MGTKFNVIYQDRNFPKQIPKFAGDFYFKDGSFEVLRSLTPEHRIVQYKNLEMINYWIPHNGHYVKGIKIIEENNPNILLKNEFKNFDLHSINFLKEMGVDKNLSMEYLASKYLIGQKIINEGRAGSIGGIVHVSKKGKYKIINFLTAKGEEADKVRETYLKNILEYGEAIFGDFGKKDLEKLTKQVVKNTSKTFDPIPTAFANRLPSRRFPYWNKLI